MENNSNSNPLDVYKNLMDKSWAYDLKKSRAETFAKYAAEGWEEYEPEMTIYPKSEVCKHFRRTVNGKTEGIFVMAR